MCTWYLSTEDGPPGDSLFNKIDLITIPGPKKYLLFAKHLLCTLQRVYIYCCIWLRCSYKICGNHFRYKRIDFLKNRLVQTSMCRCHTCININQYIHQYNHPKSMNINRGLNQHLKWISSFWGKAKQKEGRTLIWQIAWYAYVNQETQTWFQHISNIKISGRLDLFVLPWQLLLNIYNIFQHKKGTFQVLNGYRCSDCCWVTQQRFVPMGRYRIHKVTSFSHRRTARWFLLREYNFVLTFFFNHCLL